jgi:5-(carboxyamino)imidazole ribonucleotide synthase
MSAIPPGRTIGILGGGQLGRMTALAAARLGYRCHVYEPDPTAPAADVCAAHTAAAWDDMTALDRFAAAVDVITLEFENVPAAAVARLAARRPTRPSASVLAVTQDRIAEKSFANRLGIATAAWRAVQGAEELARACAALGGRCIVKTTRLGYDGKGQALVPSPEAAAEAWSRLGAGGVLIAEAVVPFVAELSVIVARAADGRTVAFPPTVNEHEHHVLRRSRAPAPLPDGTAARATAIAGTLAAALGVEGLLAVEMFLTADGTLLVNELAPRPHNSGHWTIDACPVSQFEQLVRAICGLPLGDPTPFAAAEMTNLLGAEADDWARLLAEPGLRLHLYGKREARPGRKMGHVTRLRPLTR